MSKFLTSKQNLVLDLTFELMDECRFNRIYNEYMEIASRLLALKKLHGEINDRLREIEELGTAPYEICHFKVGDGYIRYEDFPTSVSLKTVRSALTISGMRQPGDRRRR